MSLLYITQQIEKNELTSEDDCNYIQYENQSIRIDFLNDKVFSNYSHLPSNENKTIFGFLLGEVYDLSITEADLLGTNSKHDIDKIIYLYEKNGIEILKRLNGKFLITIVDTLKDEIIILNDRYGFGTCYMLEQEGKYTFCNTIHPLISVLKETKINFQSMKDFFSFGYLLGDKTMIQGINKLSAATIIKISNNGIKFEKYWEWNDIKKKDTVNYNDAVKKLGELWIKAVSKILNKHEFFNLPLSGGLDSRAIIAAVDYLNLNGKINLTYTFGSKDSLDYKIAKKVADQLNLKHELIEINETYWWENIKKAVYNSTGAISTIHSHAIATQETNLSNVYLNGFIGDLVMGGSYLNKNLLQINKDDFKKYIFQLLRNSEGISCKDLLINYARNHLQLEDEKLQVESTDYFFINDSRVRNFTLVGTSVLGDRFNDVFPFLENDLIDYLYSLPDEWRMDSKIYKDMLLMYFPKLFKDIPWQKTGYPITYNDFSVKILQLPKRSFKFLLKKLNRYGANFQIKTDSYVNYADWMKHPSIKREIYDVLLSTQCEKRGIYNLTEVKKILDEHMNGINDHYRDIGLLLTFELTNRMLIDKDLGEEFY